METVITSIIENKLLLALACFFAFIIFVYIPCLYLWIWFRNKKAKDYAGKHNAVRCYIKHTKINDILTVHSVNGQKPVIFSTGFKLGFYVQTGENTVHVSYMWQPFFANLTRKVSGASYLFCIKQNHVGDKQMRIATKAGMEYELYYNHNRNRYVFVEKGKVG